MKPSRWPEKTGRQNLGPDISTCKNSLRVLQWIKRTLNKQKFPLKTSLVNKEELEDKLSLTVSIGILCRFTCSHSLKKYLHWNLRLMHWVNRRYRNSSNSAPFKEKMTLYKSCLPNAANKGRSTVNYRHIYHLMIIVTGGFSKKSFFIIFRTSHTQMFLKTGVSRNFAMCWILFLISLLVLRPATLFQPRPKTCVEVSQVVLVKKAKFLRTAFFYGAPPVAAFASLIK